MLEILMMILWRILDWETNDLCFDLSGSYIVAYIHKTLPGTPKSYHLTLQECYIIQ